jgi:hypothetical protein
MSTELKRFHWSSIVLWSLATAVGWAAGWAPGPGSVDIMIETRGGTDLFTIVPFAAYSSLVGAFGGSILAIGQWLILLNKDE